MNGRGKSISTKPKVTRIHKEQKDQSLDRILRVLLHDIQNNLQAIRMELDLLKLDSCPDVDFRRILHAIDRANLSIQDVGDYLTPPQLCLSEEKAEIILGEMVEEVRRGLLDQGVRVRLLRIDPLPVVAIDARQFRNVLERIIDLCRALLKDGGDLEIEGIVNQTGRSRKLELRFTVYSRKPIDLDEEEVFKPFLRVNGYKVGLGMALAKEILQRHDAKFFFRKTRPDCGTFTIVLEAR